MDDNLTITNPMDIVPEKVCIENLNEICAELQKYSVYSTQSAPFIRHSGFWFFADQNIIKYCPENKLAWDNWETIRIDSYDTFDFWQKIEGELCWVGEHEKWEILVNPDHNIMPVQIRWSGNWDGEYWSR